MIKLKNIKKFFGDKTILNNINYTFNDNEIYLIKGYNGSGKTTLLNIISFLDKQVEGEIEIDQINFKKISNAKKNKFRKENIIYIKPKNNILSFTNCRIFINMLEKCNDLELISGIDLNKYRNEISGGEEMLVSLTKVINSSKKIVLLDEVTSQLDDINVLKIIEKLYKVKHGKIIIFATHDNRVITKMKSKLLELKGGVLYDRSE